MFSFDVFLCVRSRPVNQTSLKWELNANSSRTVKAMDLKFDTRVPRDSLDMTPKNFSKRDMWPGSRYRLNFSALNANSSKTVKATDIKFDTHVPRESPDMSFDPHKFFQKGALPGSRDPLNFLALNTNAWRRYALSLSVTREKQVEQDYVEGFSIASKALFFSIFPLFPRNAHSVPSIEAERKTERSWSKSQTSWLNLPLNLLSCVQSDLCILQSLVH